MLPFPADWIRRNEIRRLGGRKACSQAVFLCPDPARSEQNAYHRGTGLSVFLSHVRSMVLRRRCEYGPQRTLVSCRSSHP